MEIEKSEPKIFNEYASTKGLFVVEKYETAYNYLYNSCVNKGGQHRILKEDTMRAMNDIVRLFYIAAKSNQVSRIYEADAMLAYLKWLLRQFVHPSRKLLSVRQYEHISAVLAEVGSLIGAWITSKRKG